MKQLQCPRCKSYALLRMHRSLFTKLRHPRSRQYRCDECGSETLVDQDGEVLRTHTTSTT